MLGIFSICFRKQSKSENMQGSHDAAPVPATIFWFTVTVVVFGPRISCCRIESKQLELEGAQQVMLGRIFGLLAHFMSSTAVREIPKLRMQHGRNIGRTIILQKKANLLALKSLRNQGLQAENEKLVVEILGIVGQSLAENNLVKVLSLSI